MHFRALVEASHWLPGFADALSVYLGLNVSLMLSGPIGAKGGRIDVKAYVCLYIYGVSLSN